MKSTLSSLILSIFSLALVAQGPYYDGVDLSLFGLDLKDELSSHVVSTHSTFLSYTDVWEVLQMSDLNPENSNDVLLLYGYNDTDGNVINDRTRNKLFNGGSVGDWNREHTYPKSLGTPNLGTAGPGSDPHHLRSTDVQMNGSRGNLKFTSGSGTAGSNGAGWYPGEEWKGDVARMMMFMYLRYGDQCLPINVCNGSINSVDGNMIDLLLEWNVADPVSEYEQVRNDVVEAAQGNRNPFIDSPILATYIWGGQAAENPWDLVNSVSELNSIDDLIVISPNPASEFIQIDVPSNIIINEVKLYNSSGKLIDSSNYSKFIDISGLSEGLYFISVQSAKHTSTQRFVVLSK